MSNLFSRIIDLLVLHPKIREVVVGKNESVCVSSHHQVENLHGVRLQLKKSAIFHLHGQSIIRTTLVVDV